MPCTFRPTARSSLRAICRDNKRQIAVGRVLPGCAHFQSHPRCRAFNLMALINLFGSQEVRVSLARSRLRKTAKLASYETEYLMKLRLRFTTYVTRLPTTSRRRSVSTQQPASRERSHRAIDGAQTQATFLSVEEIAPPSLTIPQNAHSEQRTRTDGSVRAATRDHSGRKSFSSH